MNKCYKYIICCDQQNSQVLVDVKSYKKNNLIFAMSWPVTMYMSERNLER